MMTRELTQKRVTRARSKGLCAKDRWMVKAIRLEWVLLFCQFLTFSTQAANWYVDNVASGSTKNGKSWANAWTSFSSVVWGSSGVIAGDTLFISGGSTSKVYKDILVRGSQRNVREPHHDCR